MQKPGAKDFNPKTFIKVDKHVKLTENDSVERFHSSVFDDAFMLLAFYMYIDRAYPSTTKTVFLTQIRAPFLAASLTASHIPSYGQTETLLSLLSLVLPNPRWLETALSIFDISINNLQKGKSSC